MHGGVLTRCGMSVDRRMTSLENGAIPRIELNETSKTRPGSRHGVVSDMPVALVFVVDAAGIGARRPE